MGVRSMFSAISGLRAHQTWMDVIGNNIANVNTPGFKASRARFEDLISQTIRGASPPQDGRSGANPMQIGLGVVVGGVDTILTQGVLQMTGRSGDLAIQGEGYFMVSDGTRTLYTRDGTFDLGRDGYLANATGLHVLGWQALPDGTIDTNQPLGPIKIPLGQQLDVQPSSSAVAQGNLDAAAADGDTYATQVTIVDSLGFQHDLTLTFTKTGNNAWDYEYTSSDPSVTLTNATGSITFDDQGHPDTITPSGDLTVSYTNGAADTVVTGGGDFAGLTQLQHPSDATMVADGSTAGSLLGFAVAQTGEVVGVYSNGLSRILGQIATATFANPGGLSKMGENLFNVSANSGVPVVSTPGSSGHGVLFSGYLEQSNVDLAEQFTDMIRAERGFQANSRIITSTDEMLQDLVNLKR